MCHNHEVVKKFMEEFGQTPQSYQSGLAQSEYDLNNLVLQLIVEKISQNEFIENKKENIWYSNFYSDITDTEVYYYYEFYKFYLKEKLKITVRMICIL
jgi:hypothetical protein